MHFKPIFRLFAALLLASALPLTAQASPVSQLIVFGDSNVDNGNLFARFGVPGAPYYMGRFSNGLLVVEYAAHDLGVPLVDYAYGGAVTGLGNPATIPGVLTQVQTYLAALGSANADPNAAYIIWAGSNDIPISTTTPANLQQRIDDALANIDSAVTTLNGRGARNILVATRTPRPSLTSQDNLNGIALNTALIANINQLDLALAASVGIFDDYAYIADMMTNPSRYGFTEPNALCIDAPTCVADLTVAARYVQWDAAHKTTQVHRLLASALIAQIPEPASLVLLTLGLVLLAGARVSRPAARPFRRNA